MSLYRYTSYRPGRKTNQNMDYAIRARRWQLIVLSIAMLLVQPGLARECYVCGIGTSDPLYDMIVADKLKQQLRPHQPHGAMASNIGHKNASDPALSSSAAAHHVPPPFDSPVPSCTQFAEQSAENRSKFVVQCPVGYMGCLAQWDGDTEIRTCNQYLIDDCKTANRVTYCYCNKDRCNDRSRQQIADLLSLTETSQTHHIAGRMGGPIPSRDLDDEEDIEGDDEGGDDDEDDEEVNFDGSGLGPMLTTLNSFSTNGISRPPPKEASTTSLSEQSTQTTRKETEIYSPFTTASPNSNNVHHRNRSDCLAPTILSLIYFAFIPAYWLFD